MRKKSAITKLVLTTKNLRAFGDIVDKLKRGGVEYLNLISPFGDPSLIDAAPNIAMAKNYIKKRGMKILNNNNKNLRYNPYLPEDKSFFDISKAKLKINFNLYKDKPDFSVIIPTFNKKNSLKFVLNNFFEQDYLKSKYEIIVIDDGSNDKTLESIKKIKPTCNFKYFYWPRKKIKVKSAHKKFAKFYNRVGPARNIGINNAKGEIILFNDSDILAGPDCLKRHKKYHDKYKNIIVRGFRYFLPEKPGKKIPQPEKTGYEKKMHCRMYGSLDRCWQRIVTSNLSVRKKYLEKAGCFSRDFIFWGFEDVDLGYRLKKLGMKLVWDEKIKVRHLRHSKEYGDELGALIAFWLGANILYRKYLDEEIYHIFRDVIIRRLDEMIKP